MRRRSGFSLIELMLVVVLMGLIYTMATVKMNANLTQGDAEDFSFLRLKDILAKKEFDDTIRLVCLEDCGECLYVADERRREESEIVLEEQPLSYRYDAVTGMERVEYEPYFDENDRERDVCFSYRLFKNGVGEQVYVRYKGEVYDMGGYFEVRRFSSITAAQEAKEALLQEAIR